MKKASYLRRQRRRKTISILSTMTIMIPFSIFLLNELYRSRGCLAVGSEPVLLGLMGYGIYKLTYWIFR